MLTHMHTHTIVMPCEEKEYTVYVCLSVYTCIYSTALACVLLMHDALYTLYVLFCCCKGMLLFLAYVIFRRFPYIH